MAVSIGSVTLTETSSLIQWPDRFSFSSVGQIHQRTLGGKMVTFERNLIEGRPITLQAVSDQGWLTKKQVDDLRVLSFAPGGVYTLTYDTETHQVLFDHSSGPAVDFEMIVARPNAADGDYMLGTIHLLTVT